MPRCLLICALIALSLSGPARAEGGKVVASIKPLHSLVAAVMEGSGDTPVLLVDGKESLHHFSMRPSQMKALEQAEIVFYMGDGFEVFLKNAFAAVPKNTRRVSMDKLQEITYFNIRDQEAFGAHEHTHDEHATAPRDLHVWLMPKNVKVMIKEIARQLSMRFPDRRTLYFDNVRRISGRIDMMDRDLELRMAMLRGKPFITFHDAYQYFDTPYTLAAAGSITLHPDRAPGAKHMQALRKRITDAKVKCIFREPQFEGRVVDNLVAGTKARSAVLDPEGALLTPGPELYFQLMEGLAKGLEDCLTAPEPETP